MTKGIDMPIYDVRYCRSIELPLLIDFIKTYWQADHIFVKSPKMLAFQHFDSKNERYNFIIGYNNYTAEIDGILGIIPVSHYDDNLKKYKDTWGGIWKVRTDVKNEEISSLGTNLFSFFYRFETHGSIGMSNVAAVLHKIMKYKTGVLSQYYILNDKKVDFKIALVPERLRIHGVKPIRSKATIEEISNILEYNNFEISDIYKPYKSISYLYNRFQKHPIYKYKFLEISDGISRAILVTRKISVNRSNVIRIVDVYGRIDNFETLYEQFQELLDFEKAEYIDFLNYGIPKEIFEKLGFQKLNVNSELLIPNYFEPFVRENQELNCALRSKSDYVFFKADADQDRPSIL